MRNKKLIEAALQNIAVIKPYLFSSFYTQPILNHIFIWGPPQFLNESHFPWRLLSRLLAEPYLVYS